MAQYGKTAVSPQRSAEWRSYKHAGPVTVRASPPSSLPLTPCLRRHRKRKKITSSNYTRRVFREKKSSKKPVSLSPPFVELYSKMKPRRKLLVKAGYPQRRKWVESSS